MYDIIINPLAGNGKAKKTLEECKKILDNAGKEYTVHTTERALHAVELMKEINKKETSEVIVIGGDGTFNEVLNGIENFETTTIGFVPSGTGNDYVKATDIPTEVDKAMARILNGKLGHTDFINMGDKRCLNVAGGGMDTDVLVKYAEMKHFSGKIKYYVSLISVLLHLTFHKVKVSIDGGEEQEKSVFLISIANGRYIGGGMPISPNSDTNDGYLDVVVVHEIKPSKVLGLLLKFLKGKHIEEECTIVYRCKQAKIEMLDEGKTQADGEVMERKVLDCKIEHGKLRTYIA